MAACNARSGSGAEKAVEVLHEGLGDGHRVGHRSERPERLSTSRRCWQGSLCAMKLAPHYLGSLGSLPAPHSTARYSASRGAAAMPSLVVRHHSAELSS